MQLLQKSQQLAHAGAITHDEAMQKAHKEFEAFHRVQLEQPSKAETDFLEIEAELKQIKNRDFKEI